MPDRYLRFFRSVRHTRFRQLYHRLRLTLVRKRNQRFAEYLRNRMNRQSTGSLDLHRMLPLPILPARSGMIVNCNHQQIELRFLNESRRFSFPVHWHEPELQYGTRLWLLNLHYMEFLEEATDEQFQRIVTDWIENCPPFRQGYWKDDWNSYSLSIRVVVWMQQFAVRQERLDAAFRERMLTSLQRQLRFLAKNLELDIGGNHLIKNIKALVWQGRFLDSDEAKQRTQLGLRLLERELQEQVLDDGVHYERSPAYHNQVFADLLEIGQVIPEGDLRNRLQAKLDSMAKCVANFAHPDTAVSLFNDGGQHMTYQPDECLQAWSAKVNAKAEPDPLFEYPVAGYYGLRHDDDFLLVDCGRIAPDFLPAHGHGDILAFEWSVNRQRVIIDFGVFEYNPGEMRRRSRDTCSHNTVSINNESQCDFWGAFRVARRAHPQVIRFERTQDGFELIGEHDGYRHLKGKPVHRRTFTADSTKRLRIFDEVRGGQGQPVTARLLIHPEFQILETSDGLQLTNGSTHVAICFDGNYSVRDYDWCPDFGKRIPCQQIEFHYGPAPCTGEIWLESLPARRQG